MTFWETMELRLRYVPFEGCSRMVLKRVWVSFVRLRLDFLSNSPPFSHFVLLVPGTT